MSILPIINFLIPIGAVIWLALFRKETMQRVGSAFALAALSVTAIGLFLTKEDFIIDLSHNIGLILIAVDVALLLYFAKVGISVKSAKIYLLAFTQLFLYILIETRLPETSAPAIVIDELSKVMFLIINIVGGAIAFFSIKYMSDEKMSDGRKTLFHSYLYLFLFVMTIAVSANSILLFFLLFEITTLFSFLLIRFRGDEKAKENANRALWMNQIGGVAILLGVFYSIEYYNTYYFSDLLAIASPSFILPFAFIVMAAFVKGASMPFQGWLLGAMVAPTPVSALLHSATMVKIAPFIILKLSPTLSENSLGVYITLLGSFVFMVASFLALSKDFFKEILGFSTIALLGLMMGLATLDTPDSFLIVSTLIIFHGVSKALLFLSAGVLEKDFHFKYVEDFKDLLGNSPYLVFFVIFGFASMTLPPFGVFIGKLLAIESLAVSVGSNPLFILPLVFLGIGSTLLTLLYFKVAATLFVQNLENRHKAKRMDMGFLFPLLLLTALSFGIILFLDIPLILLATLIIVTIAPIVFKKIEFNYDRVKEYHCGEKTTYEPTLYFFELSKEREESLKKVFIALFLLIPILGAII